ncbi:ogr/Delta-like zinc finger family protein [Hydrogenophaga sp.]|uniref:ogr/Delta-like zinc finger family protein n=1 Tax=Hydrogenophaga sp. TaxID=1904254 RepID=UPI003F6E8DD1
MRFPCPHCNAWGRVRTSERMSPTVSWLYLQCTDLECGHSWRVDAEATVTLSPSAKPCSTVTMPLSPHVRRGVLARMLDLLPNGNHTSPQPRNADLFDDDATAGVPRPSG